MTTAQTRASKIDAVKGSKRYKAALAQVDRERQYELEEAVELLQSLPKAKFDETVEIHLSLGVDPKKADQNVRGAVSMPHGIGRSVRVICFAEGAKAEAARAAGADEVGAEDLAKKVADGWLDFDVAIAAPDMMRHVGKLALGAQHAAKLPHVGKLGRVLGPQGKMPSPKAGTVSDDVGKAVREFKAGKVEYRVDKDANIHAPVGKMSFPAGALVENARHFIDAVQAAKPATVKGRYVKKVTLTSTMGPGIPLRVVSR